MLGLGLGIGLGDGAGSGSAPWDPSQLTWSMLCRADNIPGGNGALLGSVVDESGC